MQMQQNTSLHQQKLTFNIDKQTQLFHGKYVHFNISNLLTVELDLYSHDVNYFSLRLIKLIRNLITIIAQIARSIFH